MENISKLFTDIDTYLYKYKPEVQEASSGINGVDNQEHFGAMAQDLQQNPLTKTAVKEDEEGNLSIDTNHLTSVLAVVLSDVCRRLDDIEKRIDFYIGDNK